MECEGEGDGVWGSGGEGVTYDPVAHSVVEVEVVGVHLVDECGEEEGEEDGHGVCRERGRRRRRRVDSKCYMSNKSG